MSLGKRDGLNPGGLLRVICDETGLTSSNIGKIDILPSFSFFEADDSFAQNILNKLNGADYEGNKISIEITKKKAEPRRGGGNFGGGGRDRFGGKKSFGNDRGGFKNDRKSGGGFKKSGGFNSDRSYKKSY